MLPFFSSKDDETLTEYSARELFSLLPIVVRFGMIVVLGFSVVILVLIVKSCFGFLSLLRQPFQPLAKRLSLCIGFKKSDLMFGGLQYRLLKISLTNEMPIYRQ
jgi:hypothetical protein